jgi:hypothetical protein
MEGDGPDYRLDGQKSRHPDQHFLRNFVTSRNPIGVVELQERNPINNTLENKNTKEEIPDRIEASLLPCQGIGFLLLFLVMLAFQLCFQANQM